MEKKETNYEHFQHDIITIIAHGQDLAIRKDTGNPVKCEGLRCGCCLFYDEEEHRCYPERKGTWLYEQFRKDYRPKLTKVERMLIDSITDDFFIERDDDELYLCFTFSGDLSVLNLNRNRFLFITEERAWTKKELLSLEVE